jgi:hypothetical protein
LIGRQAEVLSPSAYSLGPVSPPQPRRSTRQIRTTPPGVGRWGGQGAFTWAWPLPLPSHPSVSLISGRTHRSGRRSAMTDSLDCGLPEKRKK